MNTHRKRIRPALLLLSALALVACGGGSNPPGDLNFPDLVVAENPGAPGFYFGYDSVTGEVLVWVLNQGSLSAPSSYVSVTYRNAGGTLGTVEIGTPTGPMAPGAMVGPLRATILSPGPCFDPDCDFTIEVDSRGEVVESREDNNTRDQAILG